MAPNDSPRNTSTERRGRVPTIGAGNMAISKELFFRAGGFDESLPEYGNEDFDLLKRVESMGVTRYKAPDMLVYFRPTKSKMRLLRKLFIAGQSEILLLTRERSAEGSPMKLRTVLVPLAKLPVDILNRFQQSSLRDCIRWSLRQSVLRVSHVYGFMTVSNFGHPPNPIYPFSQEILEDDE